MGSFIACSFQIFILVLGLNISLTVLTVHGEMFPVVQPGHLPKEAALSITCRGSPRLAGGHMAHLGVTQMKDFPPLSGLLDRLM